MCREIEEEKRLRPESNEKLENNQGYQEESEEEIRLTKLILSLNGGYDLANDPQLQFLILTQLRRSEQAFKEELSAK